MLALLAICPILGLDNLAAAAAIGLASPHWRTCARVCTIFAAYAAVVPTAGLLLGPSLAAVIGDASRVVAGGLLVCIGLARLVKAGNPAPQRLSSTYLTNTALLTSGLGVSVDTFAAGFGLGLHGVPAGAAIGLMSATTLLMSLLGFGIGRRLSNRFQANQSDRVSSAALALIGVALAVHLA